MEALGFSPPPTHCHCSRSAAVLPEELSLLLRSCCSTAGMVQARLDTRAEPTAPGSWRGERGEVRAVPLLNEHGKVRRGWLET